MNEYFFVAHPSVAIAIWMALYVSDYCMTLWGARLYQETYGRFVDFDGSYELEPTFKRDINALRPISIRFVRHLLVGSAMLAFYWWFTVQVAHLPEFFLLVFGGYVLVELIIHARHVRNVRLFSLAREPGALEGRLRYRRSVTERVSTTEFAYWALFCLACFALSGALIFLGGSISALAQAHRHYRRLRRPRRTVRIAGPDEAGAVARVHVESWNVAYRGIMPDDVIARTDLAYRTPFWAERIARRDWPVFVLEEAGEIVAFCYVVPTEDADDDAAKVGSIPSLHVLPGLRGKGRGRALLDRAVAELRRRGMDEVTLWVLEGNAAARRFYEKVGFHADGGRKTHPGTDVPEVRYRIRLP